MGDDFEIVTVGIFEIDASTAVIVVDLIGLRPLGKFSCTKSSEKGVKVALCDKKYIVLHFNLAFLFQELESHGIVEVDAHEFIERLRSRSPSCARQGRSPSGGLVS